MSFVSISHSHCFQFYLEACASWTLLQYIYIYTYHFTTNSNWFHSVSYQSTQHILLHLCHTETSWKQQGRWRGYERAIGCSQRRITEVSAAEGAEGVVERRYHVYWIVWSTMILFVTYLHYCTVPCIFLDLCHVDDLFTLQSVFTQAFISILVEQSVTIICQRGCSAYTPSCVSARGSQQLAVEMMTFKQIDHVACPSRLIIVFFLAVVGTIIIAFYHDLLTLGPLPGGHLVWCLGPSVCSVCLAVWRSGARL